MPDESTADYAEANGADELQEDNALPVDSDAAESEPDETTDQVSPFAGKPFEEVAKDPVVEAIIRDREARLNESFRQRVANEEQKAQEYWEQEAYKERSTAAQQSREGATYRTLANLVKLGIERGEVPPAEAIVPLGKQLAQAVFHDQFDALSNFERDALMEAIPDYRPTPQTVAALEHARRTSDPKSLAYANLNMLKEALWQAQWPHALQAAWEAQNQQNQVNGTRNAAATRANRSGTPTQVGATRAGRGADNDAVLSSPSSTPSQRESAFKAKYGFAPP